MARREYTAGLPTTLASPFNTGDATFVVQAATNWPTSTDYDFFVTIDAGTAQEERVLCSARTGTTITVATSGRGKDGTGEKNHAQGASVWPSWSAQDADEANAHIESTGYASFSKAVHGLGSGDGVVVGTTKEQTLTLKTLTSPTISSPTISGTITGAVVTSANIVNDTIVNADINASANIDQSKISGLTTDLGLKAPLANPQFTGTVVLPSTTSIGNVSSTEIGYLDGVTSNLTSGYRLIGVKTYTTTGSTTYTIATEFPGARALRVKCQGAGGGGGGAAVTGASQNALGSSGGGGGYAEKFILVSSLSASETIKVGAGGTAGASGNNAGGTGGTSSFTIAGTETVIANGGAGGLGGAASGGLGNTAAGGSASGGDINVSGGQSSRAFLTGLGTGYALQSQPGDSVLSNVYGASVSTSGANGTTGFLYGGGGMAGVNSESQTARTGGAGAQGIVIVEYYA